MKILQINTVCGTGSTGRIAIDIYKTLEEQGHECVIAYGRGTAPNEIRTIKVGSDLSVNLHGVFTRITDRHGFYSSRATKKMIKQIKEYNPDVIHLHNIHGYFLNIELLFNYLKEVNKPVVWTLHDCWAFTGHCVYFDFVQCNNWKNGCFKCPLKAEYPTSILFDNSKLNYKKKREIFTSVKNISIVTPSKWLAGLAEQSFLGQYPVKVINNGIDLEVFKPTDSNFRSRFDLKDRFIILGVANGWGKRKGYQYFLELSNKIESDEIIVMVGLNEKQKKGLPKNIIGITRTNNVKELVEIYSESDVFVNLTLEDNFPTTNLEALACGTPIITFDTGGSVESVDDSCGFVVKKYDISQIITKFRSIKDGNSLNISRNAIERANNFYDKNEKFKEYIDLYYEKLKVK